MAILNDGLTPKRLLDVQKNNLTCYAKRWMQGTSIRRNNCILGYRTPSIELKTQNEMA